VDKHVRFVSQLFPKINIGLYCNQFMNIALFFIGLFLTFTFFLTPVGLILLYVSFKLNKTDEYEDRPEYEMNTYDEELLENMR